MSSNNPILSIGMPVYNGERFLRGSLDSLLTQDFEDFELIISDNASTDATPDICRDYASRDRRIRFHQNEKNIGVGPNHARVFELARAKYFKWTGHDVECLPGMLWRCLEVITQAGPSVVLVYPRCEVPDDLIQNDGTPVPGIASADARPHRRLATVLRHVCKVNQLYGILLTDTLRKTRLIDSFASSDYVLLAELAMLGELREIPEVLLRRRSEPGRGAVANREKNAWAAWLDPRKADRRDWLSMRERLVFEYFRSAGRLPIKPADKLLCLWSVPFVYYRRILSGATRPWRNRMRSMLAHDSR